MKTRAVTRREIKLKTQRERLTYFQTLMRLHHFCIEKKCFCCCSCLLPTLANSGADP